MIYVVQSNAKTRDPAAPKPNRTPFNFFSVDARVKAKAEHPKLGQIDITKKVCLSAGHTSTCAFSDVYFQQHAIGIARSCILPSGDQARNTLKGWSGSRCLLCHHFTPLGLYCRCIGCSVDHWESPHTGESEGESDGAQVMLVWHR